MIAQRKNNAHALRNSTLSHVGQIQKTQECYVCISIPEIPKLRSYFYRSDAV